MIPLSIAIEIKQACPRLALGCIQCDVRVEDSPPDLLAQIDAECTAMAGRLKVEDIHAIPTIAATREGYKALGKEPSRYRPSAEALIRRVLQGKGLYRVNNVVDLLNLVSIRTGFSIGGWDAARIEGKAILGIGRADELYVTIGRGEMNIEFFPVFRDAAGAFGTPTSDSERTMVRPETREFLMVFYAFDGTSRLQPAMDMAISLLKDYAHTTRIETQIIP
jgi:DNA/RNA-binding domain of Phe-tRNA-synthetase-like protein